MGFFNKAFAIVVLTIAVILMVLGVFYVLDAISDAYRKAGEESVRAELRESPKPMYDSLMIHDVPQPGWRREGDGPALLVGYDIVCVEGFRYIYLDDWVGRGRALALTPVFGSDRLPAQCDEVGK